MTHKRLSTSVFLMLVGLLLLAACQSATSSPAPANTVAATDVSVAQIEAQNLAVVQRFYDEYSAGNADVILAIHPETIVMHYAGESDPVPAQVLRDDLAALKAANPDLHAEIHSMFGAGDYVFTELTWSGTQTGEFFGIAATGNPVIHNGIVIRRLENGLIVESWEMWDDLTFLNSLGLTRGWDEIVMGTLPEDPTTTSLPGSYRVRLSGNSVVGADAGYYRVTLEVDGRYKIDWAELQELQGLIGVTGSYAIHGDQIVFTDEEGFAACTDAQGRNGTYQWSLVDASLTLTRLDDGCELRAYVLTEQPISRE